MTLGIQPPRLQSHALLGTLPDLLKSTVIQVPKISGRHKHQTLMGIQPELTHPLTMLLE